MNRKKDPHYADESSYGPHRNRHYYRSNSLAAPTETVERPSHCPRCGQALQQEPAFAFCRLGCGRMFIVDRTVKTMAAQRAYETQTYTETRRRR